MKVRQISARGKSGVALHFPPQSKRVRRFESYRQGAAIFRLAMKVEGDFGWTEFEKGLALNH